MLDTGRALSENVIKITLLSIIQRWSRRVGQGLPVKPTLVCWNLKASPPKAGKPTGWAGQASPATQCQKSSVFVVHRS